MSMDKYIGRMVVIVYVDKNGSFSQRTIRVLGVRSGTVSAYDTVKRQPRSFELSRILAVQLVTRHAS